MEWPFKHMKVGEVRVLYDVEPMRAQVTAHAYGKGAGKRFKTARVREPDGRVGIVVKRLKDAVVAATPSRLTRAYGYEHLGVGETASFVGHEAVTRVMGSIQRVEARLGRKYKRKSMSADQRYTHLRITRVA